MAGFQGPRSSPLTAVLVALCLPTAPDFACTIGAFAPGRTADGRPILWKNRDADVIDQEVGLFEGPRHRFVALVNAADSGNAWAGINDAGFAIMNSNSLNLGTVHDPPDDGLIMFAALGECATVEDFGRMMDSLNLVGRSTPANYGVFDATGMASMFEAGDTCYTRFNAHEDSLGFLLRANYSMSGSAGQRVGRNRWLRAMQVAVPENRISARFIIETLARDLGQVEFDPYPLPFKDSLRNLPRGYLPTESTICRNRTHSAAVMVGPRPGEPAGGAMMWVMLGPAEVSIPVPVWVQSGEIPDLLNGPERSPLCDEARVVHGCLHNRPECPAAINSFRVREMYDSFAPVEAQVFDLVERLQSTWRYGGPTPLEAATATKAAADMAVQAYLGFWHYIRWQQDSGPGRFSGVQHPVRAISASRGKLFDAAGRRVAASAKRRPERSAGFSEAEREVSPPARSLPESLRSGIYFLVSPLATRPSRLTIIR